MCSVSRENVCQKTDEYQRYSFERKKTSLKSLGTRSSVDFDPGGLKARSKGGDVDAVDGDG